MSLSSDIKKLEIRRKKMDNKEEILKQEKRLVRVPCCDLKDYQLISTHVLNREITIKVSSC